MTAAPPFLRQVFASLRGPWTFTRHVAGEGGIIRGTAHFNPCDEPGSTIVAFFGDQQNNTTADRAPPSLICLHYLEEGEWEHNNGQRFTIRGSHEYFYMLHEEHQVVVFKRQAGDARTIFMFQLDLAPLLPESPSSSSSTVSVDVLPSSFPFQAVGRHQCPCTSVRLAGQADIYDATYQFRSEREFTLRFVVNGPEKSQDIHTTFTRMQDAGRM